MATHPYTRLFILPSAPTVDEDETEGYEIGDVVISGGSIYDCTDPSTGAAVWTERGAGSGSPAWGDITGTLADQADLQAALDALVHGHGVLSATDPTVNDDETLGYEPPLIWVNTVSNVPWLLVDATEDAAVWLSLNTYTQDEVDDLLENIVGDQIHAAAVGTPLDDDDELGFWQAASGLLKKVTFFDWVNNYLLSALSGTFSDPSHTHSYQPLDSDLTAIAGISPSNDDIIQRKAGAWVNRTIAQLITDLTSGLSALFAPIAKGVTNGDSHDHNGGDGAQINHTTLSNIGTNTHAQIDTFIGTTHPAHTHQVPDVLIMFGNLVSVPASTTWHMNVGKTGADGTTHNLPFPVDCVIENIYLRTANGQPASGSLTATLVTGGSTVTALVATATAGGGAASYTGSGSIAVSAGTLIRVQVQNNATAGSAQISYVSLKLRYTSSIVD